MTRQKQTDRHNEQPTINIDSETVDELMAARTDIRTPGRHSVCAVINSDGEVEETVAVQPGETPLAAAHNGAVISIRYETFDRRSHIKRLLRARQSVIVNIDD